MEQAFDTLAASRKLEESGMPKPQSDATVEVVSDAMTNLVTKEFLRAELDRRFGEVDLRFTKLESEMNARFSDVDSRSTKLESSIDSRFKKFEGFINLRLTEFALDMTKSQGRLSLSLAGFIIAALGLHFAALQYYG